MPIYNATSGVDTLIADGQDDTFVLESGTLQANDHFDAAGGADVMFLYGTFFGSEGWVSGFDFRTATVLGFETLQFASAGPGEVYASFDHTQLGANLSLISDFNAFGIISVYLTSNASFSAAGWELTDWYGVVEMYGAGGAETIVGSTGSDMLNGGAGADAMFGGDGGDMLNGGAGADAMFGGDGHDSYIVDDVGDVTSEASALGGYDTVYSTVTYTLTANIENLWLTAPGNGYGNALDNQIFSFPHNFFGVTYLYGFDGNDFLQGNSANQMFGGNGNDSYFYDNGGDVITELAGEGTDTVTSWLENYTLGPNLENLFLGDHDAVLIGYGNELGNVITGNDAANTLYGLDGDDILDGGAQADLLNGGAGADTIDGGAGDDRFAQTLDSAVDMIFGGYEGADSGFDTLDYSAATGGVIVQLVGYSTTSAGALLALLSGIEAAVGSSFDDALIGNAANNRIEGGAGADWLVGQAGDDWFVQGIDTGVDRLFGDAGSDTIDYGATSAGVVVQLNGWSTINGGALRATFAGMENAVGTAFNDALIGNALDNRIAGGLGADWLVGQGGDDWFVQGIDASIDRLFGGLPGADSGVDTIDYSGASAGVVVQLSGYATTNFGGPSTTLATFSGIENAVGSAFNDALIGNAGNNRLTGGTGGDWLVGGLGADAFVYQSSSDGAGDSIRDFSQAQLDRIDLAAIDANPLTGGDDAFAFSTTRTAGLVGEAVVANFGGSSLVSLYLDADNIADMTIPVVHQQGIVMNASDFVL